MNDHPQPAPELEKKIPEEVVRELDAALADLSAHEREAIIGHHLAGMSQADIARRLGCPEGTVRARVHRGLKHLRTWYSKRGHTISPLVLLTILAAEQSAAAHDAAAIAEKIIFSQTATIKSGALAAPSAHAQAWSQATQRQMTMLRNFPYAAAVGVSLILLTVAGFSYESRRGPAPAERLAPSVSAPSALVAQIKPAANTSANADEHELISIDVLLSHLPKGVSQIFVLELPTIHAVYGSSEKVGTAKHKASDKATDFVTCISSSEPIFSRKRLEALARSGEIFHISTLYELADINLSHQSNQEHDTTVTISATNADPASSSGDTSFRPSYSTTKEGFMLTKGDRETVVFSWESDGELRISSREWAALPPRSVSGSLEKHLRAMPANAWLRLCNDPDMSSQGTFGFSAWIQDAAHGGSFEICMGTSGEMTAPMADVVRSAMPSLQGQVSKLRELMQPYIQGATKPESVQQREALVDKVVKGLQSALGSVQVLAEPRGVVITGKSEGDTFESAMPELLKAFN